MVLHVDMDETDVWGEIGGADGGDRGKGDIGEFSCTNTTTVLEEGW